MFFFNEVTLQPHSRAVPCSGGVDQLKSDSMFLVFFFKIEDGVEWVRKGRKSERLGLAGKNMIFKILCE